MQGVKPGDPNVCERELEVLSTLDLDGLRTLWRRRYGPPPALRSVQLLRYLIAWRLQAERHGGLDRELWGQLKRKGARERRGSGLGEGAVLRRVWNGQTIEVVVENQRFSCRGETYSSLSALATAITGTRWNGARFFGLTKEGARS